MEPIAALAFLCMHMQCSMTHVQSCAWLLLHVFAYRLHNEHCSALNLPKIVLRFIASRPGCHRPTTVRRQPPLHHILHHIMMRMPKVRQQRAEPPHLLPPSQFSPSGLPPMATGIPSATGAPAPLRVPLSLPPTPPSPPPSSCSRPLQGPPTTVAPVTTGAQIPLRVPLPFPPTPPSVPPSSSSHPLQDAPSASSGPLQDRSRCTSLPGVPPNLQALSYPEQIARKKWVASNRASITKFRACGYCGVVSLKATSHKRWTYTASGGIPAPYELANIPLAQYIYDDPVLQTRVNTCPACSKSMHTRVARSALVPYLSCSTMHALYACRPLHLLLLSLLDLSSGFRHRLRSFCTGGFRPKGLLDIAVIEWNDRVEEFDSFTEPP